MTYFRCILLALLTLALTNLVSFELGAVALSPAGERDKIPAIAQELSSAAGCEGDVDRA